MLVIKFNNLFSPTQKCYEFISNMLQLNPLSRTPCSELLKHPFFEEAPLMTTEEFETLHVGESHEYNMCKKRNEDLNLVQHQRIGNGGYYEKTEDLLSKKRILN